MKFLIEKQEPTVYRASNKLFDFIRLYGKRDAFLELKYRFYLNNEEIKWLIDKAIKKGYIDEEDKTYQYKYLQLENLNESGFYKIDNKEFYDYGTDDVRFMLNDILHSDIFDKTTLGGYSQYTIYPDKIQMITPKEYLEHTAKGFGITFNQQLKSLESDKEVLDHIKDVLYIAKKKLPMPYISRSDGSRQEGRHRMLVAAKLFGWNKKFPVLVID